MVAEERAAVGGAEEGRGEGGGGEGEDRVVCWLKGRGGECARWHHGSVVGWEETLGEVEYCGRWCFLGGPQGGLHNLM